MSAIRTLTLVMLLAACSGSQRATAQGNPQVDASGRGDTNKPNAQVRPGPGDFVQGDIRITPPVTLEKDRHGEAVWWIYHEGGTLRIPIHDAKGRFFEVFIDHQIGSPTPGAIYLNAYPRASNSVRVLRPEEFRQKVADFDKQSEPQHSANGSQPSSSGRNTTPGAAGSRR